MPHFRCLVVEELPLEPIDIAEDPSSTEQLLPHAPQMNPDRVVVDKRAINETRPHSLLDASCMLPSPQKETSMDTRTRVIANRDLTNSKVVD